MSLDTAALYEQLRKELGCPLLRGDVVAERAGVSRSQLHIMVRTDRFPRPIKLNSRVVLWPESEVARWLKERKERIASTARTLAAQARPATRKRLIAQLEVAP
jgi:predicted DNA-binding transcriptional regulator AlpA